MNHKRKMSNIFMVFFVILLMTLFGIKSVDVQAKEVDDDKYNTIRHSENGFDVTVGLLQGNNIYASGIAKITLKCVNNSGKDFYGKLNIATPVFDQKNKRVVSSYDVQIKSGDTFNLKTDITILNYGPRVNITIEDGDTSLFDKDYELKSATSTYKIGEIVYVLCDNPQGIDDSSSGYVFDNFDSIQKSTDYIAYKCDKDTFPDSYEDILDASCVFIANFDTSSLSKTQLEALKEYIIHGGNVVVATGKYYEKTLSGLKKIISYKVNDVEQIKLSRGEHILAGAVRNSLETKYAASYSATDKEGVYQWDNFWRDYYRGEDIKKLTEYYKWSTDFVMEDSKNNEDKISCTYADIDVEGGFAYGNGTYTSCQTKKIGAGYIYIAGLDVSDGICCVDYGVFELGRRGIENGFGLASVFSNDDKVSIMKYIVIFIIYILLITLVLYFILLKKDKKEYFWKIMPLIACAFTLMFIVIGKGYKREYTQCNYSQVTELTDDGYGMKNTDIAIMNADDGDYKYSIHTPSDISLYSFYSTGMDYESYYSYTDSSKSYTYDPYAADDSYAVDDSYDVQTYVKDNDRWKKTDSYVAINKEKNQKDILLNGLESNCVVGFRYKEKSSIKGNFNLDMQNKDGKIIGKLTNNTGYDMKNVVIKANGNYVYFAGDIAADKTLEFSQNDFTNGTLSNAAYEATGLDINRFSDKKYAYTDLQMNQAKHLNALCTNYSNVFDDSNSELCDNEIIVVGEWEGDDSFDSDWNGLNIVKQYVYCDSDISFSKNILDTTSADAIIGDTYNADDYVDVTTDASVLRGFDKVIMLYDIPTEKKIDTMDVYYNNYNNDYIHDVSVKIYNYKEDKYVTVYNGKTVKGLKVTDDYYAKDKPLRVLIEDNEDNNSDYLLPKICIKLVDKEGK